MSPRLRYSPPKQISRRRRSSRQRAGVLRLLVAGFLLAGLLPLFAPSPSLVTGQTRDPVCATSGPDTGAYEVEVCMSVSWSGKQNTGDARITASVEATSGVLPEIDEVEFSLAKEPATRSFDILTDFASPYRFILPTAAFADGSYRLELRVEFADDFEADHPEQSLTFSNGNRATPEVTDSWLPTSGRPGDPFVVGVVGDGAGGLPAADAVADLIEGWDPNLFLYLGDVYNLGTYTEFYNYYESTLGGLKEITNPVIGNHEGGAGFQGYFDYWDTFQHYYSVDAAGWHFVGIDNTEAYRQMEPGSPQYEWLAEDLAAHANDCTIIFMHHPRWGLGREADNTAMQPIWDLLVQNGVELALTGHEHSYQRWQPMNSAGEIVPGGVTQIVVGTGGHELEPFRNADFRVAAAIERRDGALRMVLTSTGADYQFIAIDGSVLDSGSIPCTVPGAVNLSKAKSKTEGRVEAELSHFSPNSDITLTWNDGKTLGTGHTDGEGNARIAFRTPSTAYGTYSVTAVDESGLTGTARLSVIPRVKLTKESISAGSDLRVYLYGFAANKAVEVRLSRDDGENYVVLGTVKTGADGSANVLVTIPDTSRPDTYTVIALPKSGERRSASDSIDVTAPSVAPEATPV
jgi:hypothetical protein